MTRYIATITHHSISRARIEMVGDTIHAAKINASREFGGDLGEATIEIMDTETPIFDGTVPGPGNCTVVASRRVVGSGWK